MISGMPFQRYCKECRFGRICPGLNANEMHVPYDRHHKVSSLIKFHQNTPNSVKYEVNMEMSNNPVKYEVLI